MSPSLESMHKLSLTTLFLGLLTLHRASAAPAPALVTVFAPALPASTALTASILGVDQAGHTTYAVEEPFEAAVAGGSTSTVTFTATIVAGTDFASQTASVSVPNSGDSFVAGVACTILPQDPGVPALVMCNETFNGVSTEFMTGTEALASVTQVLDVADTAAVTATAVNVPNGNSNGNGNGNGDATASMTDNENATASMTDSGNAASGTGSTVTVYETVTVDASGAQITGGMGKMGKHRMHGGQNQNQNQNQNTDGATATEAEGPIQTTGKIILRRNGAVSRGTAGWARAGMAGALVLALAGLC
uniref:Uncharacterized protein n=1 Tax=Mycena chlorophos TaxID=658473 RepID=A0ABQ0LQ15_MYCCL|nr:predicted protein [Mycena chlorophos]